MSTASTISLNSTDAWGSPTDPMKPQPPKTDVEALKKPEKKRGKCAAFCCGIFETRNTLKGAESRLIVKTTIRELVIYIIFLTILCILAFGMTNPTMFLFTSALTNLFIDSNFEGSETTFRTMTTMNDFWTFAEGPMLDGFYWEYFYDLNGTMAEDYDNNILYENKLLGVPRFRQLRVRNDSCQIPEAFAKTIPVCYGAYAESREDRSTIWGVNGTNWKYVGSDILKSVPFWGKVALYGGGGFVQNLATNRDNASEIIQTMKDSLWIHRGTRVIFLDFTVYNANVNLFCIAKLVIEFPPTGGVVTSFSFRTAKLLRYVEAFDFFILACEAVFAFFTVFYIVEELVELCKTRCEYFKSFWNYVDMTVIVLSTICICFSIYRYLMVNTVLESLLANAERFSDFEELAFWQMLFNQTAALNVFCVWIKVFKYISFNKTMMQMSSTLSRCSKDITGFAVMFFIVFFAFAQLGYLLFGTQIGDFRSFSNAVFTLMRTIMGDFDFPSLENANRVLGPMFFMVFIFFVFFVLLNMFLAIIADTYTAIKAESEGKSPEIEVAEYLKGTLNAIMGKLGRKKEMATIENAVQQSTNGQASEDDVRKRLKKSGFSELEIEMFLSNKETASGNGCQKGDCAAGNIPGVGLESGVSMEDYADLNRRVEAMEDSVTSIVGKIDIVLVKLETMEKTRQKRRDTMGKILDTITDNENVDEQTKRKQIEALMRSELDRMTH